MFIVNCDRCEYRETTRDREVAYDLYDSHHIPTGHRPEVRET